MAVFAHSLKAINLSLGEALYFKLLFEQLICVAFTYNRLAIEA